MMLTSRFRAATRSRSPPPRPLLRKGIAGMIRSALERVPGRRRREFEIADIGAETNSDPGADRNHDDIVHRQRRHSQAADEVGRAVDAGKTLVDRIGDRHRRFRSRNIAGLAERRCSAAAEDWLEPAAAEDRPGPAVAEDWPGPAVDWLEPPAARFPSRA